jgi:hypothetical protein
VNGKSDANAQLEPNDNSKTDGFAKLEVSVNCNIEVKCAPECECERKEI